MIRSATQYFSGDQFENNVMGMHEAYIGDR